MIGLPSLSYSNEYFDVSRFFLSFLNQDITKSVVKSPKETLEQENKRLRRETKLLRQERDILKKAAVYFAKEVQ